MIWLILAISLIVRLVLLNQSLWLDEAIEILAVRDTSYFKLITSYSLGDFHPPLYHLVLKFWTSFFGYSEIAVRIPSVIFAVATVFVIYKIALQFLKRPIAYLPAIFLALSPLHIYYSQEARMYAMATFFVVGAVYYFLKLIKNDKFSNWFLFGFLTILFLYTDYLPYFMLVVFNIYICWQRKRLSKIWLQKWVIIQVMLALFLLPWLPFLIKQLQIGQAISADAPVWKEVVGGFSLKSLPLTLAKFIIGRISFYEKITYVLVFISTASLFVILILKSLFDSTRDKIITFMWLVLPIVLGWVISIFIPVYSYFRFLFVLPAFYILTAAGIETFKDQRKKILLISLVFVIEIGSILIFWLNPSFHRENWRDAVIWISQNLSDKKSATIFVNGGQTAPFRYYTDKIDVYAPDGWQNQNYQQLFLMRYVQPIFDPSDTVRGKIENQGYKKTKEVDFNGITVWFYQK